ncbi:hypothetical protein ACLGIH_19885 [Streptomyces sp. HMX87]|uniref:hypothetical protein n=1 Tax=Streptomyces sp. HMX87 TaxID=3390849 RepID=UPI003A8BD0B5
MTMKAIPARAEPKRLTPMHLLGISLSAYTISLALYRGMSDDSALSVYNTHGVAQLIAVAFVVAGVAIGLVAMAYVIIRNSLRPMCYLAAYILAFASLALFRIEENAAVNLLNSLRFLTISVVAASAWLYQHRETCRAHQ